MFVKARFRYIAPICAVLSLGACASVDPSAPVTPTPSALVTSEEVSEAVSLAETANAEERYKDARRILDRVLLHAQANRRAQLAYAETLRGLGDTPGARERYEDLIGHDGVSAQAREGLGLIHLQAGDLDPAEGHFRDAVARRANLWRSWNGLGIVYDTRMEWGAAETAYAKALAAAPQNANVHNNLGFSRLRRGEPREAVTAFRAALQSQPDHRQARHNLRLALAAQGDYDAALHGAGRDEMPSVLNDIGYMAMQRGDRVAAESYFQRAMDADPAFNTVAAENMRWLKPAPQSDEE